MTRVQLKSEVNIEMDELIGGVAQLESDEIEHLLSELSLVLAQRKAPSLPAHESTLLQKIGEGLSESLQARYNGLQQKLLAEAITPDEHAELLGLIDVVEQADTDRLQALIDLAHRRKVSLDELMVQLGIQHPPVYV